MNDMLGKMRDLLKPWMRGTSPLEIRRAVLDDAESQVVAAGEGKRIYPYNHLRVHLLMPDAEERVRFEAVVREAWDLQQEIAARHAEGGGWWLRAEQNASGTRIYRSGRTIDVSSNDRRGVRLQPGDEIYLGRACVKVGMRARE